MKKKLLMTSVAGAMAVSVFGFQAAETHADNHEFELRVLHTNDTHANLDDVAKRVTLVKSLKAEMPDSNLLVDAGDVFSGSLYFNEFRGQADLEFMNLMGYDAMVFGNHEFDLGTPEGHPELAEFVKGADFPFVSSNVDFSDDSNFDGLQFFEYTTEFENGEIYNGVIREVNGEQVGIFGLTTEETASIASPGPVTFSNYLDAAEEAVAAFEDAGVNKIIALTHIGFNDSAAVDNDMLLAQSVEGIDIIVGGHTHTELSEPEAVGDTLIVQTGANNDNLGQLDVTFDADGVITNYEGTLHEIDDSVEADTEAAEILAEYSSVIDELKNRPSGAEAEVFLDGSRYDPANGDINFGGVRINETNLGNLITDGMLWKAQSIDPDTVIALQNGGGIRASISEGPITYGEALTVMPFGNDLAIMNLTGAEIYEALELSVSQYPAESGAFLHVAGMSFSFDPAMEAGSRVKEAYVMMEDETYVIEEDEMYKVATNVFTATGGDGYDMLEEAYNDGRVSEPGYRDYETFIEYVTSLDEVAPEKEGRIIALTPFEDVTENNWYSGYVADLYYGSILNGKSETMFDSLGTLSRAQAASFIVRSLGLTTDEEASFSDLENVAEATQNEIAAAAANGIVNGIDGEFRPYAPVTRSQLALMLYRAYMVDGEEFTPESTDYFTDVEGWGEETTNAVSFVYETGIASGYGDQYRPLAFSTRAQAAKMISVFLDVETME
ncbi:5'-nucleotidase C-terminal domain-containing protein [Jeotgalibacillus salarius]|uniref:Multifunctional 2',3'-cyclic-nucleotide 2'-phosphodiesterase/5'-nucleotidase/3'-nucleotidase n=1 Tax=Jeotgalibacillus salarius TaxID=546023 RepID=A0A4Y8LN34_9BACL|nr:5'-nucleotidase C-terminal domain-containing protein [Jeotgalibacillus salarius]TFE04003.1 multifunctional 2',3'-cyclic-nucleotide 2'-phosphodiesterase/5'-nucleotidase/3'-nucleotidase [Jeotgalibacillus salarius]